MDTRRLLLAFALSIGVMLLWQAKFAPSPPTPPRTVGTDEVSEPAREPTAQREASSSVLREAVPERLGEPAAAPTVREAIAAAAEVREIVETEAYRVELSNRGAQVVSFELSDHQRADGGPVNLVRARDGDVPFPFGIVDLDGRSSALNGALFVAQRSVSVDGDQVVTFRYAGAAGEAQKTFRFRPDGLFEVEIETSAPGWGAFLGPGVGNPTPDELSNRFARKSALYLDGEGVTRVDPNKGAPAQRVAAGGFRWVGLEDTYFLSALMPVEPFSEIAILPYLDEASEGGGSARFSAAPPKDQLTDAQKDLAREVGLVVRPAGDRLVALAYWGGKKYDRLAALPYQLEQAVNLGFFSILARPLLFGLQWIHDNMVRNYGWAIILMTILIRVLLFPLTHKSVVSMQRMQELNPKIQAIRQKFRSKLKDRQGRPNSEAQRKMNEEIMGLYKKEGVNPAGGCLPMLLQMPVLFAFYGLLSAAIELRLAPWMFWIHDLSAPDPFYVLPIIMGASQFVQQKMTPSAADPMQKRIFMLMPIFFTVLFLGFPTGLVLYWLTNNLLGIVQQLVYKRMREKKEAVAA